MARYFFHLHDRSGQTEDEVGQELPDLASVRTRAIRAARAIIQADVAAGAVDLTARVEVALRDRTAVLTLPFSEAVELIIENSSL